MLPNSTVAATGIDTVFGEMQEKFIVDMWPRGKDEPPTGLPSDRFPIH